MPQRIPISCPNCGRDLWVRVQNVGRKGLCKHCGHLFRAELEDVLDLLSVPGGPSRGSPGGATRERELEQVRAALAGETVTLRRIEGAEVRYGPSLPERGGSPGEPSAARAAVSGVRLERERLFAEIQALRARLESESADAEDRLRGLAAERDEARSERDRLAAEREALARDGKRTREHLVVEREALSARLEELLGEVGALERSRAEAVTERDEALGLVATERRDFKARDLDRQQRLDEVARQLDGLRAAVESEREPVRRRALEYERLTLERDQFAREVGRLRDQLGALEQAHAATQAELDASRTRRESERHELEALWKQRTREQLAEAKIQAWRGQLGQRERLIEERDALAREVDRVRTEVASALDEARARWESELSEREGRWEAQRLALLDDTERRLGELRERFEAERESWSARLGERERLDADRLAAAQSAEESRETIASERDALVLEVERLRERSAALEHSRQEVETVLLAERAGRESDRLEAHDLREALRRDLLAEADRRLSAQKDQLEAERLARRQVDEHSRLAAEWESLAREATQAREALVQDRNALARELNRVEDRLSAVEGAREASESGREDALVRLENQRRADQERWERERRQILDASERTIAEHRAESEARAHQEVDALRGELEEHRRRLDALGSARDEAVRAAETLAEERDRLRRRVDEAESRRLEVEQAHGSERARLVEALAHAREEAESSARLGDERAEQVRTLREELAGLRRHREALGKEAQRNRQSLRGEWDLERQRWLELLAAARPEALDACPASREEVLRLVRRDGPGRPVRPPSGPPPIPPRPQANVYRDPEAFRSDVEHWIAQARPKLDGLLAEPGPPSSPALSGWLDFEIRTARLEIAGL